MSIRQFPSLRRLLVTWSLLSAVLSALLGGALSTPVHAQTLGLAQVLEAARQNLDVSIAQQNLAAAQADVVSQNLTDVFGQRGQRQPRYRGWRFWPKEHR